MNHERAMNRKTVQQCGHQVFNVSRYFELGNFKDTLFRRYLPETSETSETSETNETRETNETYETSETRETSETNVTSETNETNETMFSRMKDCGAAASFECFREQKSLNLILQTFVFHNNGYICFEYIHKNMEVKK